MGLHRRAVAACLLGAAAHAAAGAASAPPRDPILDCDLGPSTEAGSSPAPRLVLLDPANPAAPILWVPGAGPGEGTPVTLWVGRHTVLRCYWCYRIEAATLDVARTEVRLSTRHDGRGVVITAEYRQPVAGVPEFAPLGSGAGECRVVD